MNISIALNRCAKAFALATVMTASVGSTSAQAPPPAGASPRIDAIRKAGVLRVGVVNNPPWLAQNTTGEGESW